MTELVFENIPEHEDKINKTRYVVGFRMRKKRNWKYRYVSLFKINNLAHEEYGNWIIMPREFENEFFEDYEEGKQRVKEILEIKRREFETGVRNWWTGKKVGE